MKGWINNLRLDFGSYHHIFLNITHLYISIKWIALNAQNNDTNQYFTHFKQVVHCVLKKWFLLSSLPRGRGRKTVIN